MARNFTHLMESMKYLLFLGSRSVTFTGDGNFLKKAPGDYEEVLTPEGLTLQIQIIHARTNVLGVTDSYNKNEALRAGNKLTGPLPTNLFGSIDDVNNIPAQNLQQGVFCYHNTAQGYKIYVFAYLEYYRRYASYSGQNILELEVKNTLHTRDLMIYGLSFVVTTASISAFETFLSMPMGDYYTPNTWKYYFNQSINEGLAGNFDKFLMYDPAIRLLELMFSRRVEMLNYIAAFEHWGSWDFDGQNEADIFLDLVISVPEDEKVALYNSFFNVQVIEGEETTLFINAMQSANLGSYPEIKLQIVIFLLQCWYKKISEEGDIANVESQVRNLPANRIIPIIGEKLIENTVAGPTQTIGPEIQSEFLPTGVLINRILIYTRENINDNYLTQKDYTVDGETLDGTVFAYSTILGGVPFYPAEILGLQAGRIYPFPAFALFAIDEALTKKISVLQIIGNIAGIAGIFIPFFRLAQGLALAENLTALGLGILGFQIDAGFGEILKAEEAQPQGLIFLMAFNFITAYYGKTGLYDAYRTYGPLMIKDYESFLNVWGLYQNTSFFQELLSAGNENAIKLSDQMQIYLNNYDKLLQYNTNGQ
ncbi:hypothetical protein [Flavobacterium sp.]|uniref:hypothetical protein n=2 Tax=Flavobacterium sp. TaxID=239 RepID=UPI004034A201